MDRGPYGGCGLCAQTSWGGGTPCSRVDLSCSRRGVSHLWRGMSCSWVGVSRLWRAVSLLHAHECNTPTHNCDTPTHSQNLPGFSFQPNWEQEQQRRHLLGEHRASSSGAPRSALLQSCLPGPERHRNNSTADPPCLVGAGSCLPPPEAPTHSEGEPSPCPAVFSLRGLAPLGLLLLGLPPPPVSYTHLTLPTKA